MLLSGVLAHLLGKEGSTDRSIILQVVPSPVIGPPLKPSELSGLCLLSLHSFAGKLLQAFCFTSGFVSFKTFTGRSGSKDASCGLKDQPRVTCK